MMQHFREGSTYRTVGGALMSLKRLSDDKLVGKNATHTIVYGNDGAAISEGWREFDLIPGVVEDEPIAVSNQANDLAAVMRILASHQKQINELRDRLSPVNELRSPKPPPKRTIKGGWVNYYPLGGRDPTVHRTKAEADINSGAECIACIQIPDFEEGEGL